MARDELIGYADRLSFMAGDTVRFMVSTDHPEYVAHIVRLACGAKRGTDFREAEIAQVASAPVRGRRQRAFPGSYVAIDRAEPLTTLESFTLVAWIYPTAPLEGKEQGIMGAWLDDRKAGYLLLLDSSGHLTLRVGSGGRVENTQSGERLHPKRWYLAAAAYDGESGATTVHLAPHAAGAVRQAPTRRVVDHGPCHQHGALFLIGATHRTGSCVHGHLNGKLDSPCVYSAALGDCEIEALADPERSTSSCNKPVAAAWDFTPRPGDASVLDRGPHRLTGQLVNLPMRAATGRNWTGKVLDWRLRPEEYGAIHFHDDDLEDASWTVDFEWTVPADLPSGVYAARLTAPPCQDHVPFVVRPTVRSSRTVVLLPTLTYLAYANFRGQSEQDVQRRPQRWVGPRDPLDVYLDTHPELGGSLYDRHRDGSGWCYSSRLRPIVNFRPRYQTWYVNGTRHFAADLYLIDWLETKGFPYDVITDEDLHKEGVALLAGYETVMTGSHPEYVTAEMLDALHRFVASRGNLMYLGGNGFYWVTTLGGRDHHYLEVRRGVAGTRAWESAPGEAHHATTGEPGGLWRHRGRPPNGLVGVGTASWGSGSAKSYTRTPESFNESVSWIFDGVSADEAIGEDGLCLGAAAGDEIDRADHNLGTPADAVVIATAGNFGNEYQVVVEDEPQLTGATGGQQTDKVRADMVYMEAPGGGRVFSVGSVCWCGSLSAHGYENAVSTITENVLRRFSLPDESLPATTQASRDREP